MSWAWAQCANVVGEVHDRTLTEKEKQESLADSKRGERSTMLLVQCGEHGRMAINLSLVARLENFSPDVVEIAGGQQAVQYRGQIMPLIRTLDVPPDHPQESFQGDEAESLPSSRLYVQRGTKIGLIIDRILRYR